jgi:hypothetical protein
MDGANNFPHSLVVMNFHLILYFLYSIQSYNQYQGESSISRSMPSAIECLVDMEESPDSNYHVLYQYMKDQPHISMVSTKVLYFKT